MSVTSIPLSALHGLLEGALKRYPDAEVRFRLIRPADPVKRESIDRLRLVNTSIHHDDTRPFVTLTFGRA